MRESVKLRVPATTANLGPGYDCAGAALNLYSTFTFARAETFSVEGCPACYRNEENLAVQSFYRALSMRGEERFPLHLKIEADVPVSRGLGSSSTCIVAGAAAANAFMDGALSEREMLNLCTKIEGHPDNVAPCLLGGVVSGFSNEGETFAVRYQPHPDWRFVTVIPDYEVRTSEARKAVKQEIDVRTSVYTTGHALAFLKALETGDAALASAACRDVLHEPYRKLLIPDYEAARACSLANGAAAFFISGSGSTMIALCRGGEAAERTAAALSAAFPRFAVKTLGICTAGAEIEKTE